MKKDWCLKENKRKLLSYIFIFIMLLCLPGMILVRGTSPHHPMKAVQTVSGAEDASSEYEIKGYHIDMTVHENNTFTIQETITTNFYVDKHGIFRKLPLSNSVNRLDGTKSRNRAEISNITVSEQYTNERQNGYEVIKIGDAGTTLTGEHSYTIGYTYNIGKDPLKDADELYFNLIGSEWDTNISGVTFSIHMPKEFDASSLGFSSGYVGTVDSSKVIYAVDGTTINGTFKDTLAAGQALTVRLTLPEGYFVGAGIGFSFLPVLIIAVCIIFVVIAGLLWAKFGKDDEVVETVEFYPPEGYNSAEIAFMHDGKPGKEGIISLLIYLADKGYLRIEEIEKKGLFSKSKDFRIVKEKEYIGGNEIEALFFEGLFKKKDAVTQKDLYDRFYTTINNIHRKLNARKNKKKIFESSASGKNKWLVLMIIAIYCMITVVPILNLGEKESLPFVLIFSITGLGMMIGYFMGGWKEFIFILMGLIWGGLPWCLTVLPILKLDDTYMVMNIIGYICIAVILFFLKIMPKRTPFGNEMLGRIRGFKRFLETAHKEQLESLVEQNPEYFYNVLPYTYALKISDAWMKRFETIALEAPHWYNSSTPFAMHEFNHFMNSTMRSAQSAMSSSPSSSSGGSGGGSSGGGSGGGGGGSW